MKSKSSTKYIQPRLPYLDHWSTTIDQSTNVQLGCQWHEIYWNHTFYNPCKCPGLVKTYVYVYTCFTLHSSPPLITGASVGSCAGPSILARVGAGGCTINMYTKGSILKLCYRDYWTIGSAQLLFNRGRGWNRGRVCQVMGPNRGRIWRTGSLHWHFCAPW